MKNTVHRSLNRAHWKTRLLNHNFFKYASKQLTLEAQENLLDGLYVYFGSIADACYKKNKQNLKKWKTP